MSDLIINPAHWPTRYLILRGDDVIHEMALKSAATLSTYRLVLGRCLLAIDRTRLYEKFACSGAVHYATLVLGLRAGEARTMRRVATCLENLPRLTQAAELGHIPWSKLREIVRKASPETEGFWLELASRMRYHEIERLVRGTEYGRLPWEKNEEPDSLGTRMQLFMSAETGELFQRAQVALSRKLEKALSAAEVLEHLLVEHLAKQPATADVVEAARREAGKDVAAGKRGHVKLVLKAWELSQEFLDDAAPLAAAIGGEPLLEMDPREQPARVTISTSETEDPGADGSGRAIHEQPARVADSESNDEQTVASQACLEANVSTPEADVSTPTAASTDGASSSPEDCGRSWSLAPRIITITLPSLALGDSRSARAEDPNETAHLLSAALTGQPRLATRAIDPAFLEALQKHEGKSSRLRFNARARGVTPAQRRELLRRDGYRCATPGCPHCTWLELHHVVAYSDNGVTRTYNLITLCSRCHSNVHKGRLKIEGNADGTLTFRDADGRDLDRVYGLEAAGWLNLWVGWRGAEHESHVDRWAADDGPLAEDEHQASESPTPVLSTQCAAV